MPKRLKRHKKRRKRLCIFRFFESVFSKTSVVQYRQINAGTLALLVARNGAKLEKTSLSTGGSKAPAHDIVYIAQLGFGEIGSFENV